MANQDPQDQKAEALRRMNEKIENQKKAGAPAPAASVPPPAPAKPAAGPPRARDVMAARAAGENTPAPPKRQSSPPPANIPTKGRDAVAEFNAQASNSVRVLDQQEGLPGEAASKKRSGIRIVLISAGAVFVLLLAYKIIDQYNSAQRMKELAKNEAPAERAPYPEPIPDPEVGPDGRTIYPDIPFPTAEVIPTGRGVQYGNGKGYLSMDMIEVGILNGAGEIEYVRGDDPRAKEAMEKGPEDAKSAELVEQAVIKSNTRPSENQSARKLELPPAP